MEARRICAVVQLPSADSVPEPRRDVSTFAPGIDWNVLGVRIDRPQLDALFVAWALRSITGADESPVPWFELADLTGFEPRRLGDAMIELLRIRAIALTLDEHGKPTRSIRSIVSPGALTSAYLRHALEKGGRS